MASAATIFKWPIRKFSKMAVRDPSNKPMLSSAFVLSSDFKVDGVETKFCLRFDFTQKEEDVKDYCGFYLCSRELCLQNPIKVRYGLWLENNRGRRIEKPYTSCTFNKEAVSWGYSNFVRHKDLYDSDFIKDDFLFICCKVYLLKEHSGLPAEVNTNLRKRLYYMHESGVSEECKIETNGEQFKVSGSILMAHSSVFDRMLSSNMLEGRDGTIKIEDASPELVKSFIKFLHLGEVDNLDSNARDLFVLADKYDVQQLADICAGRLSKSMSGDNIFDRLKLAFMHSNEELRRVVLECVTTHNHPANFRQILKSDEWKQLVFENDALATEIMDAVFDHTNYLG